MPAELGLELSADAPGFLLSPVTRCLRLVVTKHEVILTYYALCVDIHSGWIVGKRNVEIETSPGQFPFACQPGTNDRRGPSYWGTALPAYARPYPLFAVMGGGGQALLAELLGMSVFGAAAVLGFKLSPWLVADGLVGHGVFDFFHGRVIANPGMPPWLPAFCGSYDVCAGLMPAWLLWRERKSSPREHRCYGCASDGPGASFSARGEH